MKQYMFHYTPRWKLKMNFAIAQHTPNDSKQNKILKLKYMDFFFYFLIVYKNHVQKFKADLIANLLTAQPP